MLPTATYYRSYHRYHYHYHYHYHYCYLLPLPLPLLPLLLLLLLLNTQEIPDMVKMRTHKRKIAHGTVHRASTHTSTHKHTQAHTTHNTQHTPTHTHTHPHTHTHTVTQKRSEHRRQIEQFKESTGCFGMSWNAAENAVQCCWNALQSCWNAAAPEHDNLRNRKIIRFSCVPRGPTSAVTLCDNLYSCIPELSLSLRVTTWVQVVVGNLQNMTYQFYDPIHARIIKQKTYAKQPITTLYIHR